MVLVHMSRPPSAKPASVPNFDHSGLTLRTGRRSRPMASSPRRFVARKFVVGAAFAERCGDVLGGEHAGQHGVVAALDARHVEEARAAAGEHAARKRDARHRLPAAFADGARAVAEPLAAREGVANERMRLEALEFLERRQIRVGVIQMHDEARRHQIVAVVIDERAAAGCRYRAASRRCAGRGRAGACRA